MWTISKYRRSETVKTIARVQVEMMWLGLGDGHEGGKGRSDQVLDTF